ncbi:hypothetical protein CEXT_669401 [Caerostris extrusa]|uniref:Uncharacterized protein n=1 Tax=Caerostris extrusa TaxID=172846 RepID=A0AAV4NAK3_CAEEX|nr:hypothetical protein CEXT_669401 [Caerostris extrusa]
MIAFLCGFSKTYECLPVNKHHQKDVALSRVRYKHLLSKIMRIPALGPDEAIMSENKHYWVMGLCDRHQGP